MAECREKARAATNQSEGRHRCREAEGRHGQCRDMPHLGGRSPSGQCSADVRVDRPLRLGGHGHGNSERESLKRPVYRPSIALEGIDGSLNRFLEDVILTRFGE